MMATPPTEQLAQMSDAAPGTPAGTQSQSAQLTPQIAPNVAPA
jgi:hypothetical protein